MKKLIIHHEANIELNQAIDFYEEKKEGLGLKFFKEIKEYHQKILEGPKHWPKRKFNTRLCILNKFPYGIFFIELEDSIWIVAHAGFSQKPYYWKERIKTVA